jgi:dUTP pyrophosphatase
MKMPIKILPNGSKEMLPKYMSNNAAGMDLYAANTYNSVEQAFLDDDIVDKDKIGEPCKVIEPGEVYIVPTGVAVAIPKGYEGQIRSRSGLARKHKLIVINSPGTIDSDYRGEIGVILINLSNKPFLLVRGTRVAQLVIAPVIQVELDVVDELDITKRGKKGWGSTGQ